MLRCKITNFSDSMNETSFCLGHEIDVWVVHS